MRYPAVLVLVAVVLAVPAAAATGNALVTVGGPAGTTPQNHQNEPAVAVDAGQPNILAAGANDLLDWRPCPQVKATQLGTCEPAADDLSVGLSGVYFSFDSGNHWIHPTYTGRTVRDCAPSGPCPQHFGPIGTLPWYGENGLVSNGDPAVAFGPRPVNGTFSWANGSRLYYANLTSAIADDSSQTEPFRGSHAIAVSRLDNPTATSVLDKSSWMPPVIATNRMSATTFEDKDQVWADNAASSPFFGNVYVCADDFRSKSQGNESPNPVVVSTSKDGGSSWAERQVTSSTGARGFIQGCAVRTDSNGVVYLFYARFQSGLPAEGGHVLQKSFDGGDHWTKPIEIFSMNDLCYNFDPVEGRCVADGDAGARTDLSAAPSVDIANGAPTGLGATDEIVDAWSDGRFGLNHEASLLSWSNDGGATWSAPSVVSVGTDRSLYSAPAISPNGDRVYVVYEGLITPWPGADMTTPRLDHGVFMTASIASDGAPGTWSTVWNGPLGDLRASYPGHDLYQERIGDYVYAAATSTYGVGVWTDLRNAVVCPAVQSYRAASFAAGLRALPGAPWPETDCPGNFGNTDIIAATTG